MPDNFFDTHFADDLDRVDGRAKVTGAAKYSAEYFPTNLTYGVLAASTIAKGIINAIDTKAAEKAPGVIAVLTHQNLSQITGYQSAPGDDKTPPYKKGFKIWEDNKVRFYGQPIALVIANTLEQAKHAASLIKAQYTKEEAHTSFEEAIKKDKPLEGNPYKEYNRGEKDAWKSAPVKIEATYSQPIEVHNPMEPHAITVVWDGENKVTVYEKTQSLKDTQRNIMRLFGLKEENVRVISQYIGGAFGSAFNTWPHAVAALIGSRKTGKPVKLVLDRTQMFSSVGYRPAAVQHLAMGATQDGKLVGLLHEASANTASYREFTEGIVNGSRSLYACPSVTTRYSVYPLDLSEPTWMRGPGEATGSWALECALDELSYALKIDPLQLRLINYAENDPERNRPHSSKFLKDCYQLAADAIGWKDRKQEVKAIKEGDWYIGYGMAGGIFTAWRGGAKVNARLAADGSLTLQTAVTDMGPGTATAMTKLASDVLGLAPQKIKFEMGDSNLPPGIMQGGSGTTSSLGTTVNNACVTIKKKLTELVKDNSLFHTENIHEVKLNDLVFENGYMALAPDRTKRISYSDVLQRAGMQQLEILEESTGYGDNKYSTFSYAAHFIKLAVNPLTGVVKVQRAVSAIDAGKIVNDKIARSQVIGGVVGGIGMALMEEAVIDHRFGKIVNNNLADYHVPVHADIPQIEALFVNKPDPVLNPMGSKGMGEVSYVGVAPAIANAIYNAVGKRVRDLPITPDKLI